MTPELLEARILQLEGRVQDMEKRISTPDEKPADQTSPTKRGWRAFIGVDADNPHFAEAMRLGREWRFADSPKDAEETP